MKIIIEIENNPELLQYLVDKKIDFKVENTKKKLNSIPYEKNVPLTKFKYTGFT